MRAAKLSIIGALSARLALASALVSDPQSTFGLDQFLLLAHGLDCFCSFRKGRFIEQGKKRCEAIAIDQAIDFDIVLRGDAPPCDVYSIPANDNRPAEPHP